MLTKEDLESIGEVVNKRFETFEIKIEGKINAVKEELKTEITASEERTKKELRGEIATVEERLRSEILAARMETKADNLRILGKQAR